jgi:hypothetical protein
MPDDSKLRAERIAVAGPQLRADRRGYLLGADRVDGFDDRSDLDTSSRRLIAGWARAFAPDSLDAAQRRLLDQPAEATLDTPKLLARAAIENAESDMPIAMDAGLYSLLSTDEISAVREPWLKLGDEDRRDYPLNASELARLTETTAKQIRSWEEADLLPAYWIGGRRHFFSAAAVHAFALKRLDRNEIRGVSRILSTQQDDPVVALVAASLLRPGHTGTEFGLGRWLTVKSRQVA